jgi:hypothetical protein
MTKRRAITSRLPLHAKPVANSGSWVKGHTHPGPGRPRGSRDLLTREIKQALLGAVEFVGEQLVATEAAELKARGLALDSNHPRGIAAYLVHVAEHYPIAACALLARVMPQQVEATHDVKHTTYHTFEEVAARLRALGLEPRRIYQAYPALDDEKKTKPTGGEQT